jgi:hypothetical protein
VGYSGRGFFRCGRQWKRFFSIVGYNGEKGYNAGYNGEKGYNAGLYF